MDSLIEIGTIAKHHAEKRIEQLNQKSEELDARICELEGLTSKNMLSDMEFDVMRQLLYVFKNSIEEMTIEQKRTAIRTIVRKVVWDGVNAHVVLFGVQDEEIDFPTISNLDTEIDNDSTDEDMDELEQFSDVDYNDGQADNGLENRNPSDVSKAHWGEDSK